MRYNCTYVGRRDDKNVLSFRIALVSSCPLAPVRSYSLLIVTVTLTLSTLDDGDPGVSAPPTKTMLSLPCRTSPRVLRCCNLVYIPLVLHSVPVHVLLVFPPSPACLSKKASYAFLLSVCSLPIGTAFPITIPFNLLFYPSSALLPLSSFHCSK